MTWSDPLPPLHTELGCYTHPYAKLHLKVAWVREHRVVLQERALHNLVERVWPACRAARIPLTVVSSYRSCAKQCELIQEHGGTCPDGIPGVVASVGRSYHNIGLAIDLYPPATPGRVKAYRAILEEHGWHNFSGAAGSDPNHWTHKVTG